MLEARLLQVRGNGALCLNGLDILGGWGHIVFIFVVVTLSGEIVGSFMLVRATELEILFSSRKQTGIRGGRIHIGNARGLRAYHMRNTHIISCCGRR